MHRRTWISKAAALAFVLPALVWAQDTPVTGQEVQEVWVGKELVGTVANGARFFMRFEKDGTASIAVGNFNDTGVWRGSETGYCAKWVVIRSGEERCFTVVKNRGKYKVLNPDGSVSGYVDAIR
jgi:hypothetical protein